jgi:hypothetical protein
MAMGHGSRELTCGGAGLAALAALLVSACSGGVPAKDGSAAASPQSAPGPAGAPAGGGGPQGAPAGSPPPSGNPQSPGDGTNSPTDTSGWARDRNGNLIGPTGW